MSTAAQSNSELIAAYLDAVIRKDAAAVDRYFDPNVEYMVNGTLEPDAAGVLPPISADCQAALPWLAARGSSHCFFAGARPTSHSIFA